MNSSDAKRLKELEKENSRPKKLVADLSLDNAILKERRRENSKLGKEKAISGTVGSPIRIIPAAGLPGAKSMPKQCKMPTGRANRRG